MPMIGGGSNAKPTGLPGPGTYTFDLLKVELTQKPRGKFADPTKGQSPDDLVDKLVWTFVEETTGEPIEVLTSLSTADNSTFYTSIGPALSGGMPPCEPNAPFDTDVLIGNSCLGGVQVNERGFAKITTFTAMPKKVEPTTKGEKAGIPL